MRSSYTLEDAATEFQVQGLELDWACVTWDGDFRFVPDSPATPAKGHWEYWSFVGNAWQRVKKAERQRYLKNAYRVLLTRARQGMVIVVPEGDFLGVVFAGCRSSLGDVRVILRRFEQGDHMDISNIERAAWAEAALVAWKIEKGERGTDESDARDLIADLLHMLTLEGRNALGELRMAQGNFEAGQQN